MDRDVEQAASSNPESSSSASRAAHERGNSTPVREYRGAGIMWSGVAVFVVTVALLIVAVQNTHDVEFEFLWIDVSSPLILIMAITFGIALVTSEAVGFVWRHRSRRRRSERDELQRLRRRT